MINSGPTMWAYQLQGPRHLIRREVALETGAGPGEVIIGLEAGGICGSDLPKFLTTRTFSPRDRPGPGFPMHEIAGTVIESGDDRFLPGSEVCGYVPGQCGLAERVRVPADTITTKPPALTMIESVVVQPLATVLYAVDRLPDVRGRMATVIGLGPIGLLFCRVLADRGARVLGIDPVDRSSVAAIFGIGDLYVGTLAEWLRTGAEPSEICVEAVGHQTETIPQAIQATALLGHLYAFGVPDDHEYTLPFREAFDRAITLYLGVTHAWPDVLGRAAGMLDQRPELARALISHVVGLGQVNDAYALCASASVDRLKVLIDARSD